MKKINRKQLFAGWVTVAMLFLGGTAFAQKWNVETSLFMNHQNFKKGMGSEGYSIGIGYRQYLNKKWSIDLNVAFSQSRFLYSNFLKGSSFGATDMDGEAFDFRYAANFYLETDKWNSLRVPLTVQYETGGSSRWYVRTGVLVNLVLGEGNAETYLGNLKTSGYYPQYDAELTEPKFAGFGDFGYQQRDKEIKFENTYAWVFETGVKWMVDKKERQSVYLGVFLNLGLNNIRPKDGDYGRLVTYTANANQPIDYRNIWQQESLKDKKLQDYVLGIRFGYAFGGR